jgi:hypothetical protein
MTSIRCAGGHTPPTCGTLRSGRKRTVRHRAAASCSDHRAAAVRLRRRVCRCSPEEVVGDGRKSGRGCPSAPPPAWSRETGLPSTEANFALGEGPAFVNPRISGPAAGLASGAARRTIRPSRAGLPLPWARRFVSHGLLARLGCQQCQERPGPGQTAQRLPPRPSLPEAAHQSIKPLGIHNHALHEDAPEGPRHPACGTFHSGRKRKVRHRGAGDQSPDERRMRSCLRPLQHTPPRAQRQRSLAVMLRVVRTDRAGRFASRTTTVLDSRHALNDAASEGCDDSPGTGR